MRNHIYITLLVMLLCISSWTQPSNIVNGASPKLKGFLSDSPDAAKTFTNAISNALSNKTVPPFYFYSNDESLARAYHFYPHAVGTPDVVLCIRENQTPLDEFITTLFETLNTKNEPAFTELSQNAYYGKITNEQFAKEVLRNEFEATKGIHSTLLTLNIGAHEISETYYCRKCIECPTHFDDFLIYSKKVSQRDVMKEYELKYDSLRNV